MNINLPVSHIDQTTGHPGYGFANGAKVDVQIERKTYRASKVSTLLRLPIIKPADAPSQVPETLTRSLKSLPARRQVSALGVWLRPNPQAGSGFAQFTGDLTFDLQGR